MAGGLLLGGRLADMFGRRRLFLTGVGVFAVASATSGAAASPAMLVASRFAQTTGAVISGVLNDVASWRWIFYINCAGGPVRAGDGATARV